MTVLLSFDLVEDLEPWGLSHHHRVERGVPAAGLVISRSRSIVFSLDELPALNEVDGGAKENVGSVVRSMMMYYVVTRWDQQRVGATTSARNTYCQIAGMTRHRVWPTPRAHSSNFKSEAEHIRRGE